MGADDASPTTVGIPVARAQQMTSDVVAGTSEELPVAAAVVGQRIRAATAVMG